MPGVTSLAGRHRFDDYGNIRDNLRRGEPLIIDDVNADPRTRADPDAMHKIGISALVNMPVRKRERTVAVLIVYDIKGARGPMRNLAFLWNVADRVEAGVARARAEDLQTVLNRELSHRLKPG